MEQCAKRWKNIRDHFVREVRKIKKKTSGDAGPMYKSRWPLFGSSRIQSDTDRNKSLNG